MRDGRPSAVSRAGQRNTSVPRSNSGQRPAVPRPPSRVEAQVSPSEKEPRSGRPSPDHVYSVSNARDAQHVQQQGHAPHSQQAHAQQAQARRQYPRGPLGTAGAMSSRPGRAASHGPGNAARQGTTDATRTPVFAYLKVYGLNQYARAFAAAGLSELDAIGKLSETEALDFLAPCPNWFSIRFSIIPSHSLL